jgi:hypothetical protein
MPIILVCQKVRGRCNKFTIDRITTQGKFKALTILTAKDVFPEPLEPAIPIIYTCIWLSVSLVLQFKDLGKLRIYTNMGIRPRWTVVNYHSDKLLLSLEISAGRRRGRGILLCSVVFFKHVCIQTGSCIKRLAASTTLQVCRARVGIFNLGRTTIRFRDVHLPLLPSLYIQPPP